MRELLLVTKAVADGTRLRALRALHGRELCVCQIVELLGLAPSTVSKHLWILRQARLIEGRKEGRWMFYGLAGDDAPRVAQEALAWVNRSLAASPKIKEDARRLKEILKTDPAELCRRQSRS